MISDIMILFNGLDWEISSVLHRHDGTFYFIRRMDGDTTTVCEVEEVELMGRDVLTLALSTMAW